MKKVFTSLLIIGSLAMAQESDTGGAMYVGLDIGATQVDRSFEVKGGGYSYKNSNDDKAFFGSAKIGFGKFENNRLELGIQRYDSDSTSGNDSETIFNSSSALAVSADYLITMPSVSPVLMPFIKLGVNVARTDIGFKIKTQGVDEKKDTIYALGGTVGAGLTFQITKFIDVLAGYDFTYRKWQDMTSGPITIETNDKIHKLYAGANLRF